MFNVVKYIVRDVAVGVASGAAYETIKWGCEKGKDAIWQLKNRR